MSTLKPHSRAGQLRAAERTLCGLLRTPKTRAGLVAAVTNKAISRNYVFGWLSERGRDGTVMTLKSGNTLMYQITKHVVVEVPTESIYPSWLDPRALPMAFSRQAYFDGVPAGPKGKPQ